MRSGAKIIFVDEIMFSRSSSAKKDWSKLKTNTIVSQKASRTDYVAVIAAISSENGVEKFSMFDWAVGTKDFS